MTDIPHFAIPFRFDGSRGAVVDEQDSADEIMACVETICRYTIGDRPEKPEFGLPDQTFASPTPKEELIRSTIAVWEERVGVDVGRTILDKLNPLIQNIKVEAVNE